ncbi:hypothetical protein OIU74_013935 [Salix koriyanagi]|uniref:Uncharacterized protein n=1 Tax=Salix koriyanagi TaxID=2511006 RepID=A0A9Q0PVB2_9ROSI|nr:hypothetical protein OIU74_013935 [Salix koriyanagi]
MTILNNLPSVSVGLVFPAIQWLLYLYLFMFIKTRFFRSDGANFIYIFFSRLGLGS